MRLVIAALLVALSTAVTAVVVVTAPPAHCTPIPVPDDVPQAMVDRLLADGWKGDPTDGMEALYPPGCRP